MMSLRESPPDVVMVCMGVKLFQLSFSEYEIAHILIIDLSELEEMA